MSATRPNRGMEAARPLLFCALALLLIHASTYSLKRAWSHFSRPAVPRAAPAVSLPAAPQPVASQNRSINRNGQTPPPRQGVHVTNTVNHP